MTSQLGLALRKRFKRPADAMKALGLPIELLAQDSMPELQPPKDNPMTSMQPTARDSIRRRLTNDRARRAFDEMSDEDINKLRDATRSGGDIPFETDESFEAKHPTIDEDQDEPVDPDLLEQEAKMLRDGDSRFWDVCRQRLSPADLEKLRDLVMASPGPNMNSPATDDPPDFVGQPKTGDGRNLLGADSALRQMAWGNIRTLPSECDHRITRAARIRSVAGSNDKGFFTRFPAAKNIKVLL